MARINCYVTDEAKRVLVKYQTENGINNLDDALNSILMGLKSKKMVVVGVESDSILSGLRQRKGQTKTIIPEDQAEIIETAKVV